jgi:hypothetical protein
VSSEIIHEFLRAEVRSRPSATKFEMAHQSRVAIDRIKFRSGNMEQFSTTCIQTREAGLRLLDALERIEALDRRFQIRSRGAADRNGTVSKGKG